MGQGNSRRLIHAANRNGLVLERLLVMDNYAAHKKAEVRVGPAKSQRVRVHFTPSSACWTPRGPVRHQRLKPPRQTLGLDRNLRPDPLSSPPSGNFAYGPLSNTIRPAFPVLLVISLTKSDTTSRISRSDLVIAPPIGNAFLPKGEERGIRGFY